MFKFLRYYSITSLVAVIAAAVLLAWFYRQVAVQSLVQLAERGNLTLAHAAMNPIKPSLLEFLHAAADYRAGSPHAPPLPPELSAAIRALMQDRSVVRIKIFNRHGVVVFSTRPSQVGTAQNHNTGFHTAISGGVGSHLVYRDTFNAFDGHTEEDNLMQTYIPVRASPTEPIHGVFELYADVNNLVHQTERNEFIIIGGATLILSALYAALVAIVHRAHRTIESQQRTIRERTETLELLSAQMLKSEESDKRKLAFELHEGLAQTLAALKLKVENGRTRRPGETAGGESADGIIPVLQEAIKEVRTIATDLRPPSLDDLGLLPTLTWLCREFEDQHPGLSIERQIVVQENDVPNTLKAILYRIVASVLDDMAKRAGVGRIYLALWRDDGNLMLLIDDAATGTLDSTATPLAKIDPELRAGFARMEELTTLSGGTFTASHHSAGNTTLRATWKC